MVTDRSTVDRAQILLVGAVAIALVLIGLVVVFNTVLFTDVAVSTEPGESASEAKRLDQQVRNETRVLVQRTNDSVEYPSAPNPDDRYGQLLKKEFHDDMNSLADGLRQSMAQTGPTFVDVTYDNASSTVTNTSAGSTPTDWEFSPRMTVRYETEGFSYENTWQITVSTRGP